MKDIHIVTHCVADLNLAIDAWTHYLDYRLVERGTLSADLCAAWDTPADAGRPCALLQPASGAPVYLRFIETGAREGYWLPVTWGWNATEILVQDPDELAAELEGSPFRRFGGPGDLYAAPRSPRAIQVLGPSGEGIYFTRLLPGGSRYGLKGARSRVDRVFNVVVGGPSMQALQDFYSGPMGLRVHAPMPFVMTLAAQACGAPPDTQFPIAIANIRARHSILELDEYPSGSRPRIRPEGCLPGGMAMVSFAVDNLQFSGVALRAVPRSIQAMPYAGRQTAVITGPAGEWIELIEN